LLSADDRFEGSGYEVDARVLEQCGGTGEVGYHDVLNLACVCHVVYAAAAAAAAAASLDRKRSGISEGGRCGVSG